MGRLLKIGSEGADVRAVQDVLNFQIRRLEPLVVDGKFGNATAAHVREFQRVNKIKIDGIVGPVTEPLLFQVSNVPFTLMFLPTLQLPQPGQRRPFGIQPPQLIPPLQLPPITPPQAAQIVDLRLSPGGSAILPTLAPQGNVMNFQLKTPTRLDAEDPNVRTRRNIVEMIDLMPANSKFKAFIISQIPNPAPSTPSAPAAGFRWGVDPLFDPTDPKGFGVKGNAAFTARITGGSDPAKPNIVIGAWGDGQAFLNFTTQRGQARPKLEGDGKFFLGVKGVF